jgi:hypothetical protein
MLKDGAAVTAERSADGVIIQLPGPATITQQPDATPDADGSLTLLALDADPYGTVGGNIHVDGPGADAYLTDWTHPDYLVEYPVKTDSAGKWQIHAELAANSPARIHLQSGESSQRRVHRRMAGWG